MPWDAECGYYPYREPAPQALLFSPALWETAGVRETVHGSRVFIFRGARGVMQAWGLAGRWEASQLGRHGRQKKSEILNDCDFVSEPRRR